MNLFQQNKLKKQIIPLQFLISFWLIGCTNISKESNHLSIHPRHINIGNVQHNVIIPVKVLLSNNSVDSITLLGISESCTCIYDSIQLPIIISPKTSTEVRLSYQNMDTAIYGAFSQKIVLHTNADSTFQHILITGTLE